MSSNWNKNNLITLSLILGGVLLFCNACKKKCFKSYEFIIPFTVHSTNDTISISDTLWVKADFSDDFLDHFTNETYKAEAFNMKTNITFRKLTNDTIYLVEQEGAFSDFNIIQKIGKIDPYTNKDGSLDYLYNHGQYQIEFGLIPKKKGVFNFQFYYDVSRHNQEVNFRDTRCEQTMNHMRFLVNMPDNNYYLRDQHSDLSWARDNRQIHTMEKGCYTFIVQ